MAEENFETFVQRERDRLQENRQSVFDRQEELERQLVDLDRQLAAIDAYEAARNGKSLTARQAGPKGAQRQGRRGSKREALLQLIKDGNGLSRGDIIQKMGLKGDKSAEMSVSNALTALLKSNQVRRNEAKKYILV